jgi:hypothetical protein
VTDELRSALHANLINTMRDRFAGEFAARVAAAIPEVRDFLDTEAARLPDADLRRRQQRAAQSLYDHRSEIQQALSASVIRRFDTICNPLLNRLGKATRLSLDSLTLVGDEQLEDEIAARDCGRRLREQCEYEFWGLTQRVAKLVGMEHLKDDENPVMPHVLAQALMDALATAETGAAVHLAMFRALGPRLFDIVPAVYTAANELLTDNGIDLEVDYQGRVIRSAESKVAAAPATAPAAGAGSPAAFIGTPGPATTTVTQAGGGAVTVDPALLEMLGRLMAIAAGHEAFTGPDTEEPVGVDAVAGSEGDLANARTLRLRRRHRVEERFDDLDPDAAAARLASRLNARTLRLPVVKNDDPTWLIRLHETQREQILNGNVPHSEVLRDVRESLHDVLDPAQRLITDLVTVVFDRLRSDGRLHDRLQEVINRLQLPLLEAALADRTILADRQHIAWRLIDLIAEFAMTVGDDDDDSAVRTVENMVDGLSRLQPADTAAFQNAHRTLADLLFHHQDAALLQDAGVSRLEEEESRARAARQVDRQLAMRLSGWMLPSPIIAFLETIWHNELVNCFMQEGTSSIEWKVELAVIDELLASVHLATNPDKRERLAQKLDSVFARPPEGLSAEHQVLFERFRAALGQAQAAVAAGAPLDNDVVRFEPAPGSLDPESESVSATGTWRAMATAPGDWLECTEPGQRGRWRLNWVTTAGTAVLKHFETRATWILPLADFKSRIDNGSLKKIDGLGLATEAVEGALRQMSQRLEARR